MPSNLLENKEWLYEQYIVKRRSANSISKELKVRDAVVKKWLVAHNIKTRNLRESRMPDNENFHLINDIEFLKSLYVEQGLTCKDIAKKLSCGVQTIYRRLVEAGIEIKTFEKRMLEKNPKLKKLRSKKWLYQRYITEKKLSTEIAQELGTSATLVYEWLNKHGIPIRDSSETHSKPKYTDEQMEQMLKSIGKRIGRIPSSRDIDRFSKEGLCPSSMTYGLRGGIPFWQKKVFGKHLQKWRAWEYECISLFNKVLGFPEFKREKRFNWLRSPLTNYHLRVDVFYPDYKLCVEFDGEAHFKPIKFLPHQDPEQIFERVRLYDAIKNDLIPKNGLKLLRFKHDEPLDEEYIKTRLREAGIV
jgi:transposase-like protein